MRPISKKNRQAIDSDPFFRMCARRNLECDGRITIEHAFTYAGRQMDELWSFVPLCWYHHLGKGLNKEINQYIALSRATEEDMQKYDRLNLKMKWFFLKEKYWNFNPRA